MNPRGHFDRFRAIVTRHLEFSGPEYRVLMFLELNADNESGETFVSVETVAMKTEMGTRNAERVIAGLQRKGWLTAATINVGGRGRFATRRITIPLNVTPAHCAGDSANSKAVETPAQAIQNPGADDVGTPAQYTGVIDETPVQIAANPGAGAPETPAQAVHKPRRSAPDNLLLPTYLPTQRSTRAEFDEELEDGTDIDPIAANTVEKKAAVRAFDAWSNIAPTVGRGYPIDPARNETRLIHQLVEQQSEDPTPIQRGPLFSPRQCMIPQAVDQLVKKRTQFRGINYAIGCVKNALDEWARNGDQASKPPAVVRPAQRRKDI